jgi:hypothetical protein
MSIGKAVGYLFVGAALTCLSLSFLHDIIQPPAESKECSDGKPIREGLDKSTSPTLRKLQEYETLCHGSVADQLMMFSAMPTSPSEAAQLASATSETLKEFARFNITPLVVFEPTQNSPTIISDIKNGIYDDALKNYFSSLKSTGITDQQMGTWVLFPEANTPTWHNTNPSDFQQNVKKVAMFQKATFPISKVSILLNSRSYPGNDTSWSHGELASLLPYVDTLPDNLVDSFGYQGFPSEQPANSTSEDSKLTVDTFLPIQLALDAAQKIGVDSLWLNTGTYAAMYTNDPAAKVMLSAEQRATILSEITGEAKESQSHGYITSVNLFAEDKSNVDERTNWAYWTHGTNVIRDDSDVLRTFLHQLRTNRLGFSLYDHE